MSESPAFQFYANDFLGGRVATYELDEIGLYSVLLAFDWSLTGLPVEPEKLAKLARVSVRKFASLWQTVGENFVMREGRYFNPRLELERAKQADNRRKRQHAAHSRWNAGANADALQMECLPSPTPSPSPTPGTTASSSPDDERRNNGSAPVSVASADVSRLLEVIPESARPAWEAEIRVARDGMHGPALSAEQIDLACRDYVGNGIPDDPSLRHFRGFLRSAALPPKLTNPRPAAPASKQEQGRAALANWVAGKETNG